MKSGIKSISKSKKLNYLFQLLIIIQTNYIIINMNINI